MPDDAQSALALQIDRLMRRLNARVHAQAPLFDTDKIGPIGGMVLMTLSEVQPAPMQRISELMGRDKAQLSRLFANLERRELVKRSVNDADQRSSLLSLTPKGEIFVHRIKEVVGGALEEILEPLSGSEKTELLRLLSRT